MKRLWKKERLQVKKRRRRSRKPGICVLIPEKVQSPNHVWTVDFVHDRLSRGGRLQLLSVVDEFTRQCLCLRVERSLKSENVRETLEILFKDYGKPLYLRSDNGSEFIARCLQNWLMFIEPGSPWQNGLQPLAESLTDVDTRMGASVNHLTANYETNASIWNSLIP